MTDYTDTICAISTPPGVGGIAVARVSGPQAIDIVSSIWRGRPLAETESHKARLGTLIDRRGEPLDQAVATIFRAPRSFTGEETVELAVHGSRYIQGELLESLIAAGCRLADPGEFTRRAFAAGRMDLAEAEAVADVIAADSRAAHRIAVSQMRGQYSQRLTQLRERLLELASLLELELDFSEEEVEFASRQRLLELARETNDEINRLHGSFAAGQAIRDGIPVAIVGVTNAGKSSLLNALLHDNRAIVSDIHGTTRDTIEEILPLGDFTFRFIDTAGLRDTTDPIEQAGIDRSRKALSRCRIAIHVIDPAQPIDHNALSLTTDTAPNTIITVNKADIHPHETETIARSLSKSHPEAECITISAATEQGLGQLRQTLIAIAEHERGAAGDDILVTNIRHARALADASAAMTRVIAALSPSPTSTVKPSATAPTLMPEVDLIAIDLREAIHHLAAITGDITAPDILAAIFSRFCVGK